MNSDQLKQFKAVADYGNMTKAAEAIYISQPALSYSIRKIEEELGCRLFDRSGNRLILNENGRKLLTYCNRFETLFNELYQDFKTVPAEDKTINIKTNIPLSEFVMEYFKLDPETNINISKLCPEESADTEIEKNDVLVLDEKTAEEIHGKSIRKQFMFTEELMLCVQSAHPFAEKTEISVPEIATQELAVIRGKDGRGNLYRWIRSIERKNDVKFEYAYEVTQPYWKLLYNISYPFFCYSTICLYDDLVTDSRRHIMITDPDCRKDIYICYRKENAKKLEKFLEVNRRISEIYLEKRRRLQTDSEPE